MAVTAKANKPRLKNLDDLFLLNNGVNPLDEQSVPIIETQPVSKRAIISIAIEKLTPFAGHPFHLYEGERLDDMVASIKTNGVLVPIIVRLKENSVHEILAGHNRVNATKLAGLNMIPAIIFDNISDEDAMVYVVETNLIQRSFSDMAHSEKAAVIAMHHSKMFSQGKRNDIIKQINMLENPHEYKENGTCAQVANKSKTITKVGQDYGLSKDTVARYLRVNQLIPMLKVLLDENSIAFLSAVKLSYLKEGEQTTLYDCLEQNSLSVDMIKADALRQLSDKGKLDDDNMFRVLSGGATPKKPQRTPTVKVSKAVYAKYFKPAQPAKEVQGIVEKALEMYFEQQ